MHYNGFVIDELPFVLQQASNKKREMPISMCNKCHNELVNALLEIPSIEDFATRTDLLVGIPNYKNFDRHKDSARTDLSQTVKALVGLTAKAEKKPLKIFIDNARSRVPGYTLSDQLEKLLLQYEQCHSQDEEQANQESTTSQQQSPGANPATSKKKNSASGDEHAKSGPGRNPYGSLEYWRQVVADIGQYLDTVPGLYLTIPMLESYVNSLIEVITVLLGVSKEEVRSCLRSKEGVLNNIREARDALQIALQQLIEKNEKGKNDRYFICLRKAREKLTNAIMFW